jgi:hypothetical protein
VIVYAVDDDALSPDAGDVRGNGLKRERCEGVVHRHSQADEIGGQPRSAGSS